VSGGGWLKEERGSSPLLFLPLSGGIAVALSTGRGE